MGKLTEVRSPLAARTCAIYGLYSLLHTSSAGCPAETGVLIRGKAVTEQDKQALASMKKAAAEAALDYVPAGAVVGVGTGSTANYFIDALAARRLDIAGAVASSEATAKRLRAQGIEVLDLNSVNALPLYVDGADEVNPHLELIKGGGGALTREKIVAEMADTFVCICDQSKLVKILGEFPLPVEVIPMARALVARKLVALGGQPAYREGCVTDNGNVIMDVRNLDLGRAIRMEERINNMVGVVCNGLFARRPADVLLLGTAEGVETRRR